jgi:hypothetical protein
VDKADPMGLWEVSAVLRAIDTASTIPYFESLNTYASSGPQGVSAGESGEGSLNIRTGVHPENYGSPFRLTSRDIKVDYDGTPGAYGRPGVKGVEKMANAAPGDGTIAYRNGKPVVENGRCVEEMGSVCKS